MKALKLYFILIPLLIFFSCEESENEQTEVEAYVIALKSNLYDSLKLPEFTDKNIDELLEYRNEKYIITKFPINPVSSFHQDECELGIYILWTIEYIRLKFVNSDLLIIGKYPSMNPILKLRNSEKLELVNDVEAHQIVSDAYYIWWTSNKDTSLIGIMEIDPLEITTYKWH